MNHTVHRDYPTTPPVRSDISVEEALREVWACLGNEHIHTQVRLDVFSAIKLRLENPLS